MYVVYCFQLNTLEQKVYELFEKTFINGDGEFSYFYFLIYVQKMCMCWNCSSTVSLNVLELYNYYKISAIHIKKHTL